MKIYFRILEYAPRLRYRLTKFFLFAVLGVAFQSIYIGLIYPLLDILFKQDVSMNAVHPGPFEFSSDYVGNLYAYTFKNMLQTRGPGTTLMIVCGLIVLFVFLANLFRYFERITASRIKVDVVKNMRMEIFDRVSRMHIGFFTDQRKGDLISRFTNDIAEVEGAVVNGSDPQLTFGTEGSSFPISMKISLPVRISR